jgi:hypothetical protein
VRRFGIAILGETRPQTAVISYTAWNRTHSFGAGLFILGSPGACLALSGSVYARTVAVVLSALRKKYFRLARRKAKT